jgi:hypothetical protein
MRSANHWALALGVLKLVGRWSVVLRIILIAMPMAAISVLMLVTRTPAWNPAVCMVVCPSDEQTTPTPPPPWGDGRGQAEPSVKRVTSPCAIAFWVWYMA